MYHFPASTDGRSHSVQVYSDISAEWVSGDNSLTVTWNSTTTGSILTHQVQLQSPTVFGEVNDHTQCLNNLSSGSLRD